MFNQKSANIIERKLIVRTGVVLYTIASSSSDYTYFVTVTNGKIDEATHQDCKGFHYCGKCLHVRDINAIESELVAERKMAAYLNTYDDMAAEKTQAIAQVRKVDGLGYRSEWYPRTSL